MISMTEKVRRGLVGRIAGGELKIGELLPPNDQLAGSYRCSVGTVERVLLRLASEGLVQRVRRLGTVVVRRPAAGHVSVLLSPDGHTNLLLQKPLMEVLRALDYTVGLLAAAENGEDMLAQCMQQRRSALASQALIAIEPAWSPKNREIYLEKLAAEFPKVVVFSNIRFEFPDVTVVVPDAAIAAERVMKHLLGLGHRRIAIFAGAFVGEKAWAGEAFERARELAGDATLVPTYGAAPDVPELVRKHGITAYWALNDYVAVLAINHCLVAGLRVPRDISIVGRFDTPWARDVRPALSSVSINPNAAAQALAGSLAATRGRRPRNNQRVHLIEPHLIVRDSTAAPPAK